MTPERWQKIEQLYHAALDRDVSLRAAYLQEACAGDDSLRQEVESLLAQDRSAQEFLEKPAFEAAGKILADQQRQSSLLGRQLGSYKIISSLGAGGMGEVYKALDTRLERTVAIKVLPAHLAVRAESRERFEREAKTIASLNHPHICTLHDTGHQDGIDFLVMEYVEGETLARRLEKGPLPIQQVLQYAVEIADALDKAHRKGVIHRDLKPGNIMLTKSGTKLLDFGLAKLGQPAAPGTPESQLATMQDGITGEGTILGTLQYMAPEQIEAKKVDARTDIFAFGAVVYEMTTGKRAFEGKSSASVMAKILEAEPPAMTALQPMTPPALDRVVRTCLAKEPDERWQAAGDLCRELKWIAEGRSLAGTQPLVGVTVFPGLGRRGWIVGAGALLVALAAALATWTLKPAPSQAKPVSRFAIMLPPGQQLVVPETGPAIALSPDGTYLAYVAQQGASQQVYLRALDALEARPIPGTEEPLIGTASSQPFFSPDSHWLGFFSKGKLMKVSVSGGAAVTLCQAEYTAGASWGNEGNIVVGNFGGPLVQVPEAGGTPRALTRLEKGENNHTWPQFLPGSKAVLFVADSTGNDVQSGHVEVKLIGSGEPRVLVQGTHPYFANSGHLIYDHAGTLMAVPFDPKRLTITGEPTPAVEGVLDSSRDGDAQYSVSSNGSLAYVPGVSEASQFRMVWVTRNGSEEALPAPPHYYVNPRLSPDGQRVAVGLYERERQVWIYDLSRETLTRFTFQGNNNVAPSWTPDGKRIVYISNQAGPRNLFWQLADGGGGLERLTNDDYVDIPSSWSPDGKFLAFSEVKNRSGYDIMLLRTSDRGVQSLLQTQFNESAAQFSPDGKWLAYASDESGRSEIYVQPYPGPGGKWLISTEGGREPLWNRNGRELFYRNANKVMAVAVTASTGFSPGTPRTLFEGQYSTLPTISTPNYDVSPDGQRFLMLKAVAQDSSARQINVVLNWFEELKQRVPAR